MGTQRKMISQPSEYWEQFKAAAEAQGDTLSGWIAKQCLKAVNGGAADTLPSRPSPGRPTSPTAAKIQKYLDACAKEKRWLPLSDKNSRRFLEYLEKRKLTGKEAQLRRRLS